MASMSSRSSMSSIPSIESTQEGKPYFSDETTLEILKYLEFSNLQYKLDNNSNNSNSNKYMVNLFCLYKIAEILKQVIDRKNANNNIFSSKSASGFASYMPSVSRIASYMPSMSYFRTKKNTNPNTKKPNTKKNNNKNSQTLIMIKRSIEFIINDLILQRINNDTKFISNANESTGIISIILKIPMFFNQTIIYNINLEFNPEIINQQKLNNNLSKFTNKSYAPQINTTTQFKSVDEFYYIQDEYFNFNDKIIEQEARNAQEAQRMLNIIRKRFKSSQSLVTQKPVTQKPITQKTATNRNTLLLNLKSKFNKNTNKITGNEKEGIKILWDILKNKKELILLLPIKYLAKLREVNRIINKIATNKSLSMKAALYLEWNLMFEDSYKQKLTTLLRDPTSDENTKTNCKNYIKYLDALFDTSGGSGEKNISDAVQQIDDLIITETIAELPSAPIANSPTRQKSNSRRVAVSM